MSELRVTRRSFEEQRFSDDFMFGKVMEDLNLCRDVLECLLGKKIGNLKELQTQKEIRLTEDGKPIRLDVFSKDSMGHVYDAEMQNQNPRKISDHELSKRSRFYQGSLDLDHMNKGNHFKTLPDSTIMFICTFDPYELGLCQYTFTERCHEADLGLGDGTTKIFFNATYKGDDISEKLAELYRYIDTGEATGELSKRIDAAVEKGHRNEAWRGEFMKEWVVLMDAKQEGIEEGIEIGRKQERANTRKEKKRADEAEARVKELEAMLAEAGLMKKEE